MLRRVLVVCMIMSSLSCAQKGLDLRNAWLQFNPSDKEETWERYIHYLKAVSDGAEYNQKDVALTVGFFERVTGIPSGMPFTGFGILIDRQRLTRSLLEWEAWYVKHGPAFRWEQSECRFVPIKPNGERIP